MMREYVFQTLLGKAFDPLVFGPRDLESLFRHYDSLSFQNDFSQRSNRRLWFSVSARPKGLLGTFRVSCSTIFVEVAPVAIATAFQCTPLKFQHLGGDPCETEGHALLVVLEHIAIHLLDAVFASRDSSGGEPTFPRLAFHHFSHPLPPCPRETKCTWYSDRCLVAPPPKGAPTNVYFLQNNSCYLDTLLMIILGGGASAWREAIFTTDVDAVDYSRFLEAFPAGKSVERIRSVAYQLQTCLFDDYSTIFSNSKEGPLDSSAIRDCFASILPAMKIGGAWTPFSASVVYDLLADFFPALKTQCPVRIVLAGENASFKTRPFNLLQMWDFLDPLTDTEGSYEEILWDQIRSPMLVFQNGNLPPIREFDSLRPENANTKTVYKQRAFAETLLGGRYKLGGVVSLVGGGHYVGYLLAGGKWYYYNDSGGVFREVDALPREGVWQETGRAKPDLLFYFSVA